MRYRPGHQGAPLPTGATPPPSGTGIKAGVTIQRGVHCFCGCLLKSVAEVMAHTAKCENFARAIGEIREGQE